MSSPEEYFPPSIEQLIEKARNDRPKDLGVIEPELRHQTPRRNIWNKWLYLEEAVIEWQAVRGWVCFFHEQKGHPEGPDYYYAVAWDTENGVKVLLNVTGYDKAHWFIGSNAHYMWFHSTIKVGSPVTLLIPPADATKRDKAMIYGMAEPHIKVSPVDIIEFMKSETDPGHIAGAIDCFDEIFHRLAKQNPTKLKTLLKAMGKHIGEISSETPRVIANKLTHELRERGVKLAGLPQLVEHLSDEYVVRFAAS